MYGFQPIAFNGGEAAGCTQAPNFVNIPNITLSNANEYASIALWVDYGDDIPANTPTSWTLTSGSFPPGMSLNSSTGVVSGTDTGGVNYYGSINVEACNDCGCDTLIFDWEVAVTPLFDKRVSHCYNKDCWRVRRRVTLESII